jgi:hypothetical protein
MRYEGQEQVVVKGRWLEQEASQGTVPFSALVAAPTLQQRPCLAAPTTRAALPHQVAAVQARAGEARVACRRLLLSPQCCPLGR